ncbi:MAG: leucyl aminopeptidase family protein [Bacteroidia bacterium]|nr:leucyl aminopeptidase family protein [Bacteroidia bacterium]
MVVFNRLKYLLVFVVADTKAEKNLRHETLRKNANDVCSLLNSAKSANVLVVDETNEKENVLSFAEGLALSNYQFFRHKPSATKEKNTLQHISVHNRKINDKDIADINAVVQATVFARDLVNEPVSHLNAEGLAKEFQKLGKAAGFKVEVLNKEKIVQLKMGGLLSVNQGSVDPPTFSIMEYKPANAKNKKPYVLVGKGVVYDTGGLSLKPTPNSMDSMKCDMGGGAVVGCTLYALAKAKIPVHVIGLVPATDNRPGFNAFAPGDIVTMYSGMTVEMLNSDAEGRMILGDALQYAKRFEPKLVLEFSTLTGAAAAAIGPNGSVVMGNADEKTKERLKSSGEKVHERLAEFPFWEDYDDLLKSEIADIKNIGGPHGGAITAGRFLVKFTDYPYMHFDIAGPAFLNARDAYRTKGGTGVGVRLLFDFFKSL